MRWITLVCGKLKKLLCSHHEREILNLKSSFCCFLAVDVIEQDNRPVCSMQSAEDGAMSILKGMMQPDVQSGVHYGPANRMGPPISYHECEVNSEIIDLLWQTSQNATDVVFEI